MSIHVTGFLDGKPFTYVPEQGLYPDNTPWVKGLPPREMLVRDVIVKQASLQDFMAAVWYIDCLWKCFEPIDVVIPFFPGARQDRSNSDGDILETKAGVVEMLSRGSIWSVTTFDIHSDKHNTTSITNVPAVAIIKSAIDRKLGVIGKNGYYDTVIAPDEGARKRAQQVADMFHVPCVVAEKHRDLSTGRIVSYKIDTSQTEMRNVLVVDDICDGGATFKILSNSLPAYTKRDLYVTHGLFSQGTRELRELYDNIITTDSVYAERGMGIEVIDLFPGVEL